MAFGTVTPKRRKKTPSEATIKKERSTPRSKKFFILWNPDSAQPPTQRFATKEQAEIVAAKMAETYVGKEFYVLQVISVASTKPRARVTAVR